MNEIYLAFFDKEEYLHEFPNDDCFQIQSIFMLKKFLQKDISFIMNQKIFQIQKVYF